MEGERGQEEDNHDKCIPHLMEVNLINSMHSIGFAATPQQEAKHRLK